MDNDANPTNDALELAAELTAAWLSNPNTRTNADDVPKFLKTMFETVSGIAGNSAPAAASEAPADYTAAVTARKSLASPDHIISMIDGKQYKTLRRHLSTNGLTPQEYRDRYNLKADYPMVAPTYSEARRSMAKSIGLGRKPGQQNQPKAAPAPARKPRTPKAETPSDNG